MTCINDHTIIFCCCVPMITWSCSAVRYRVLMITCIWSYVPMSTISCDHITWSHLSSHELILHQVVILIVFYVYTALLENDINSDPFFQTLTEDTGSICILINAVPDDIVESNETFAVSLEFSIPRDMMAGDRVDATIIDNDGELCSLCILYLESEWNMATSACTFILSWAEGEEKI